MSLQFHNTLSQRKEEFVPIRPPQVGLYTCGPTVYDFAHIGNLRAFTFDDLLRRYLEYRGYQVKHVMNITDVEDRIIRKVRETGRPLAEVTGFYTEAFFGDLEALNIRRAHVLPRATETIPEIIEHIRALVDRRHAYRADDGSVYFSIQSFPGYGKLSHRKLDEQRAGARVKQDDYAKEQMADFALWKAWDEADGPVKWPSPWGDGRPGWHIECSVMSMKHLGPTFDIHCGGEDLVFPHHEDEIAQSEAMTGQPFVRYWLHNAHLLVEGKKMSKSLGNFFTVRDLLAKGWTGREVRYALLSAHYRDPLNFTMDGLHAARAALQRMDEFLLKIQELLKPAPVPDGAIGCAAAVQAKSQFEAALDDDLNISGALGALFEFVREMNKRLVEGSVTSPEAWSILESWKAFDQVLGFGIPRRSEAPPEILELARQRVEARAARDYKRADEIRAQLTALGWLMEDAKGGFSLKRKG